MKTRSDRSLGSAGAFVHSGEWETAFAQMLQADSLEPIMSGDALQGFAVAAYMTGREDAYVDLMGRAFDAFQEEGASLFAARCAFWIGLTLMFRGEFGRGGGWLARAGSLVEKNGIDCAETGYVMLPKVEMSFVAGDNESALRIATEALLIGEHFGDEDLSAMARHLVGRAHLALGDILEGLSALDETMVTTTEGRLSPIVTGLIFCSVIEACQQYQILQRAREWTDALTSWCASQPDMIAFTGRCLIHRSEIMLFNGRWPEAEAEASAAIKRLADGPGTHNAGPAFYQRGEVFRLRGCFDEADECYRAAGALGFDPQPGLALMRLRQRQLSSSGASIRRALAAADTPTKRMRLLPAAFEIMLSAGEPDTAAEYCDEMEAHARTFNSESVDAAVAEMQGEISHAAGLAEQALQRYSHAAAHWRELQIPYRLARVRLCAARACASLDDAEGALVEAQAAHDGFASLGAEPDRDLALAIMRQINPRKKDVLTPRQLEVLAMIAKGLTNREIAVQLKLSERTVDRHVSDILNRIDAPTRSAAAAYAVSNGLD